MKFESLLHKIIFASVFFLFLAGTAFAQAELTFEESTHDFGKIQEGSIATHEFRFVNTGDQPLIISNVRASCGCTTPFYTKEPILPGKEGVITASYNSKNRPGVFHKSISVNTNAATPSSVLYIKGEAVKETDPTKLYSTEELAASPVISLPEKVISAGKLEVSQAVPLRVTIENKGKSKLVISSVYSDCRCVAFRPGDDMIIAPGESKKVELRLQPPAVGNIDNEVRVYSNDLRQPEATFRLKGEVVKSLMNNNMLKEGSNNPFEF
ncbi:DUF1573 domain-containing protein [Roseivirga sp. BDSF3-8]|uniref:DUF1573 domain-containing protein n=1 Tax=Roseivirga sp. BDSF3-8 TaxID=3241598 RepID=UPI0035319889